MPVRKDGKLFQELIQATYDKLTGVQIPDGNFNEVLERELDRAIGFVENRIRTSLEPVRKTDMPKTVEECYADRSRFKDFINQAFVSYPKWENLTDGQKFLYGNNPNIYKDGTLPWDLLTEEQRLIIASNTQYAENKIDMSERQDGKGKATLTTFFAPIVNVHSIALAFTAPPGYEGKNLFFRLYKQNEFLVYHREGMIEIFPAVMARILSTTNDPLYGSQYGVVAPRIPQVIKIDYEYGYTDQTRPAELVEAVAIKTAMTMLLYISNTLTMGLQGFGVDGFNASFNGMIYKTLYDEYNRRLNSILAPYYRLVMSSY